LLRWFLPHVLRPCVLVSFSPSRSQAKTIVLCLFSFTTFRPVRRSSRLKITRNLWTTMSSAFVRGSLHRARLVSRPTVRSYATGPSSTNANVEKAQKFAQKVRDYPYSSSHFPRFCPRLTLYEILTRRMSRLKTGQANSRKQQNHISALLESVYQVLQDVRNTPRLIPA
jgi:hypothetical protein